MKKILFADFISLIFMISCCSGKSPEPESSYQESVYSATIEIFYVNGESEIADIQIATSLECTKMFTLMSDKGLCLYKEKGHFFTEQEVLIACDVRRYVILNDSCYVRDAIGTEDDFVKFRTNK